jgi:hypothetical protein
VIAEGVDRPEQLAFLRRSGCDAVQAFMSCPPLPPDACTSWLRQASGRREAARTAIAIPTAVALEGERRHAPALPARAG